MTREEKRQYNRMRYWRKRKFLLKQQKEYRKQNVEKLKAYHSKHQKESLKETYVQRRGYALKAKYGIDYVEYKRILKSQNGVCAICGGLNKCHNTLAVDHDHLTGRIRGLLCSRCNIAIGGARDSITILQKCIDYLVTHKAEGTTNG
jgi:hypothetical protein